MIPAFVGGIRVGVSCVLALLAALCGSSEAQREFPISLMPDSSKEGLSRTMKETVVRCALLMV